MTRRTQGEGSVYMRKDGRAAASAMYEGKRITKYGKTKKEAKEKLDAYLADLRAGKVVMGPKQTVEQYLTHWLEDERRLRIALTSLMRYRSSLKAHIIPALGHIELSKLSREHVQSFYADLLDGGLSAGSIRHVHGLLTSALKDAVRHEIIARNPCQYVTLPRGEDFQAKALTQEEAARLIEVARGHRLWFLILMAITTGARLGELLALRWVDLNEEAGKLRIGRSVARVQGVGRIEKAPKTKSGRRPVRLPQVILRSLEAQRDYITGVRLAAGPSWKDRDLVFPNRVGDHMDHWVVLRTFKQLVEQAGLPVMRFHDLRHSAATLLLAAGVNVKVVQEMLGHADIRTTLGMYGHVLPDMQKDASDKMDDLFGDAQS
ncbi:MAG TPA: tyrosine-type recombinase/integrase [Ktedonobacteraceae bacterium]|nr:tyrosine-type recombinase/integrase [Ktedonobacteraceae bacterium]